MKKLLLVFGTRAEAFEASSLKLVGTYSTMIANEIYKLLKDISLISREKSMS